MPKEYENSADYLRHLVEQMVIAEVDLDAIITIQCIEGSPATVIENSPSYIKYYIQNENLDKLILKSHTIL